MSNVIYYIFISLLSHYTDMACQIAIIIIIIIIIPMASLRANC
jgi:hypothetical protein